MRKTEHLGQPAARSLFETKNNTHTHTLTMPTLFPGWNFVPLCLTMMFPGMTYSPPNFFTPKYFGFESLPFLLVPPAFFVAVLCPPRNPKLLAATLPYSQENKVVLCSWDCPPDRQPPENSFATRERTPPPWRDMAMMDGWMPSPPPHRAAAAASGPSSSLPSRISRNAKCEKFIHGKCRASGNVAQESRAAAALQVGCVVVGE